MASTQRSLCFGLAELWVTEALAVIGRGMDRLSLAAVLPSIIFSGANLAVRCSQAHTILVHDRRPEPTCFSRRAKGGVGGVGSWANPAIHVPHIFLIRRQPRPAMKKNLGGQTVPGSFYSE